MNSTIKSFMVFSLVFAFVQTHAMNTTQEAQGMSAQTEEQSGSRLGSTTKVVLGLVGTTVAVYGAYVAYMNRNLIQDRFAKAYDNCTWQEAEALQKTVQDGFVNGAITVKDYAVDFGVAIKDTSVNTKNWVVGLFSQPEVQEATRAVINDN